MNGESNSKVYSYINLKNLNWYETFEKILYKGENFIAELKESRKNGKRKEGLLTTCKRLLYINL